MHTVWTKLSGGAALLALLVLAGAFASASYAADTGTICAENEAQKVKLSPGLEAPAGEGEESNAHVQNITIKGVLKGCTGSTVTEAKKYVAHLKTNGPVDCSVLTTGETATGTIVIKWRPKGSGNSHGSMTMVLIEGPTTIFGDLEGSGPFEGLGLYGPSSFDFGASCPGAKKKLKRGTLSGSEFRVTGPPHATIESPGNEGVYTLNQVVPTTFSCSENEFGPGLESCIDSNEESGGAGVLDTSELGEQTYSVTARSIDGLKHKDAIHYEVVE
jgi:hypothetical protein